MPPPIIEFTRVSKRFGSAEGSVTAVDALDLSIHPGEIFGIIGYSGAGKSTLVRLINGLEKASSGSIRVNGQEIVGLSESQLSKVRSGIGMIFQQFNLLRSRTVAGNVEFPLKVAGWPKERRLARVAELLDFVGLLDRAHDYPEQLSGGQKQRVGIARALASSPAVLLADEATSALDPETTHDVLELLRRTNRELGVTIVVITHEMDVVRAIADRVAVLDRGRVVEIGSSYDVFANPASDTTKRFLKTAVHTTPDASDIARLRARFGGTIATVRVGDIAALSSAMSLAQAGGASLTLGFGGIDALQDREFGSLTFCINGSDSQIDAALRALAQAAPVEVVSR